MLGDNHNFEEHESIREQLLSAGETIARDVVIDFDPELLKLGIEKPTSCYFELGPKNPGSGVIIQQQQEEILVLQDTVDQLIKEVLGGV
jgi:hypothetical protein